MDFVPRTKINRNALILTIITSTVIIDQITKVIARNNLPGRSPIRFLDDLFILQYSENTGAFLSLGANLPEWLRVLIFSILVGLILGWVAWSLFKDKDLHHYKTVYLSLIVGGGTGNLIDRITRGSVTDFMNMGFGNLRTGIFNVADIAVTAAAVIMLIELIHKKKV